MTSTPPDDEQAPARTDPESDTWAPRQVMRDRATATRRQRDQTIADLRTQMSDEQVLEEYGIDLGEIER